MKEQEGTSILTGIEILRNLIAFQNVEFFAESEKNEAIVVAHKVFRTTMDQIREANDMKKATPDEYARLQEELKQNQGTSPVPARVHKNITHPAAKGKTEEEERILRTNKILEDWLIESVPKAEISIWEGVYNAYQNAGGEPDKFIDDLNTVVEGMILSQKYTKVEEKAFTETLQVANEEITAAEIESASTQETVEAQAEDVTDAEEETQETETETEETTETEEETETETQEESTEETETEEKPLVDAETDIKQASEEDIDDEDLSKVETTTEDNAELIGEDVEALNNIESVMSKIIDAAKRKLNDVPGDVRKKIKREIFTKGAKNPFNEALQNGAYRKHCERRLTKAVTYIFKEVVEQLKRDAVSGDDQGKETKPVQTVHTEQETDGKAKVLSPEEIETARLKEAASTAKETGTPAPETEETSETETSEETVEETEETTEETTETETNPEAVETTKETTEGTAEKLETKVVDKTEETTASNATGFKVTEDDIKNIHDLKALKDKLVVEAEKAGKSFGAEWSKTEQRWFNVISKLAIQESPRYDNMVKGPAAKSNIHGFIERTIKKAGVEIPAVK